MAEDDTKPAAMVSKTAEAAVTFFINLAPLNDPMAAHLAKA
ncbi:hypothetical protein QWY74_00780 [Halomonas almeriensis]|nr:hypothetical protein [Halomonas almeriensis]MDN3552015.1 hypothetical protein [Halomonas almeriensis]